MQGREGECAIGACMCAYKRVNACVWSGRGVLVEAEEAIRTGEAAGKQQPRQFHGLDVGSQPVSTAELTTSP